MLCFLLATSTSAATARHSFRSFFPEWMMTADIQNDILLGRRSPVGTGLGDGGICPTPILPLGEIGPTHLYPVLRLIP